MSDFVDEVQVNLRGGDGGAGCVSFRREPHVPHGGPDGGDGGRGGDVWLIADRNTASLLAFRDHPHRRATSGKHGSGKRQHGAGGEDLMVHVPVGSVVKTREGSVLADLTHDADRFLAVHGGQGGKGNARFLSNSRRAPSFAEQGEYGEDEWLRIELKLLADAALVGFPNAGKSTLIAALSASRPKIADYPFTTLIPNLGVVRFGEHEFVLADIPGLIEGAADGRGLGHQFLRHIERARVMVVLVDLASLEHTPEEQERILLSELGKYRPELIDRPRLVVGSRADVAVHEYDGELSISAVTRSNLDRFQGEVARLVEEARAAEPANEGFVVLRPEQRGLVVERDEDGVWRVHGRAAERTVAMMDLNNPEAMAYVQHRLRRLGVEKLLAKAGAKQGDVVRVGPVEMEYVDADYIGEARDARRHGETDQDLRDRYR